jgi:hypothetical protein
MRSIHLIVAQSTPWVHGMLILLIWRNAATHAPEGRPKSVSQLHQANIFNA